MEISSVALWIITLYDQVADLCGRVPENLADILISP